MNGDVDGAVAAIRAGKAVIIPTDTVYGLVADGYREAPARLLYRAQAAPRDHALRADGRGPRRRSSTPCRSCVGGRPSPPVRSCRARTRWCSRTRPGASAGCAARGPRPSAYGYPRSRRARARSVRRVGVVASTSANVHGERGAADARGRPRELRAGGGRGARRRRAARRAVDGHRPDRSASRRSCARAPGPPCDALRAAAGRLTGTGAPGRAISDP